MRKPPSADEIAQVKAEGHQFGWLRSRMLGLPWPREDISACGRLNCPICDAALATKEVELHAVRDLSRELRNTRSRSAR
jgi:hypothetical protein